MPLKCNQGTVDLMLLGQNGVDNCGGSQWNTMLLKGMIVRIYMSLQAKPSDVGNIFFRRYCRAKYQDLCGGNIWFMD